MRDTFTTSNKIHPKSKSSISKYETDRSPLRFFYVISDDLTSGIHSYIHKIGSRSSVTPIRTLMQPYPDASMDAIYDWSPVISSVHLVYFAVASCSSCQITPTDCLTAIDFDRFTHDVSLPSNEFTGMNRPFSAGTPIVAQQDFPMTEPNVLKYTLPLKLIAFRSCNIPPCLSDDSSMNLSSPSKIHPSTSFLVYHSHSPFYKFSSNIGSGMPSFVTSGGGNTFCIPWRRAHDRCIRCSSSFVWQMLMKSSKNPLVFQ